MHASNISNTNLTELIEEIVDGTSKVKSLLKTTRFSDQILLESQKNLKQCAAIISKVQSYLTEEVKENTYQVIRVNFLNINCPIPSSQPSVQNLTGWDHY